MDKNNFFLAIKPAVILCKYLGILPFSYDGNKLNPSKCGFVLNVILSIMNAIVTFKIIAFVLEENIIDAISDVLLILISGIQVVVTHVNGFLQRSNLIDLVHSTTHMEKHFLRIGAKLPDKRTRIRMYFLFFILFTLNVVNNVTALYSRKNFVVVQYLYSNFFILFTTVLLCYASLHVSRIKDGFEMLNLLLMERIRLRKNTSLKLLQDISIIHHKLTGIIKKINTCFGLIMLLTFATIFLVAIENLHESYKALKNNDTISCVYLMSICITFLASSFLMCHVCETTVEEVHRPF